jgi:maltose alpha-D-glucosyltransferase/alpha-amylase
MRNGPFGYRQVNVEAQRSDRRSFLNWTERAIRTRKEWPEFGWGEWRVLPARNPAILAHIATWDGTSAMAVHNFSDAPARCTIQLPTDARAGRWRHIFGPTDGNVPEVAKSGRFSAELSPYGYHWFGRREGV